VELKLINFQAPKRFIQKFIKRHSLVTRRLTRLATKTTEEVTLTNFFAEINVIIGPAKTWNYDEIPIFFEPDFNYTLIEKGEKAVSILSVLADTTRMTLTVTISASGNIIPNIILFFQKVLLNLKLAKT